MTDHDNELSAEQLTSRSPCWSTIKNSLFFKVVLLLVVPCSIQLVLLAVLAQLWGTVVHDLPVEQEKLVVVRNLDRAIVQWQKSSLLVFERLAKPQDQHAEQQGTLADNLQKGLASLRAALKNDRESLASAGNMETLFQSEMAAGQAGSLSSTRQQGLRKLSRGLYTNYKRLNDLMNVKKADLECAQFNEDSSLWVMKLAILVFGGVAVAGAVIVARYVSRYSRLRLGALMKNVLRLQRNEAISPSLEGSDEFSRLEKVICDVLQILVAAADERRSVLKKVAHDVRAPLQAVLASITVLRKRWEIHSEAAVLELTAAEGRGERLMQQIQEILSLDKSSCDLVRVSDSAEARRQMRPAPSELSEPGREGAPPNRGFAGRLRVMHKVLLLSLLPMVVQISLSCLLIVQVLNTQAATEVKRRYSRIQVDLSQNLMDQSRVVAELFCLNTQKEKIRDSTASIFAGIDSRYSDLERLVKDDPEWSAGIEDFKLRQLQFKHKVQSLKRNYQVDAIVSAVTDRKTGAPDLPDKIIELATRDNARISQCETEQLAKAAALASILGWAAAANIILAGGLVAFFYFDIAVRMKSLLKNAGDLASHLPLSEKVTGTDELNILDTILHEASRQLGEASSQKVQLMSSLTAEMQTPLQQVRINLKNVARLSGLEGQALNLIVAAQNNIRRILALINDLLSMEQLETGQIDLHMSLGDARAIAGEAIATASAQSQRKKISIINECQKSVVACDPDRITQVLVNFLTVAINFSPDRTTIYLGSQLEDESIKMFVSDQSSGMDEATAAGLFDKCVQSAKEEKKQSFGARLAICKLIAEKHGGSVGVESERGKGSIFWIKIPPARKDNVSSSVSSSASSSAST